MSPPSQSYPHRWHTSYWIFTLMLFVFIVFQHSLTHICVPLYLIHNREHSMFFFLWLTFLAMKLSSTLFVVAICKTLSSLWLSNIPLCVCTIFFFPIIFIWELGLFSDCGYHGQCYKDHQKVNILFFILLLGPKMSIPRKELLGQMEAHFIDFFENFHVVF